MQLLLEYVYQYGYFALFLFILLGIVGTPIPNEVIVMVGGFITSQGILNTFPAFLVTYVGVISGLTLGYGIGRLFGPTAIEYLLKKKKMKKHVEKAKQLVDTYGSIALIISYFIPVVRHVIPYFVGSIKMPFMTYAIYSYSAGLIWTTLYFIIGKYFGDSIEIVYTELSKYIWLFIVMSMIMIIFKKSLRQNRKKKLNE